MYIDFYIDDFIQYNAKFTFDFTGHCYAVSAG